MNQQILNTNIKNYTSIMHAFSFNSNLTVFVLIRGKKKKKDKNFNYIYLQNLILYCLSLHYHLPSLVFLLKKKSH